jgi:hypothetical protein
MGEDSVNPDFKTTTYYHLEPLTEEEILSKLKDNFSIYREFKRFGIITSKQYFFINKITFSQYEKNCVEGKKSEDERLQANKNIKVVEHFFNSYQKEQNNVLRVAFAERNDNECALYNPDRFNESTLQNKLIEIFN